VKPQEGWTQRKAIRLIYQWKEAGPCVDCRKKFRYFQIEADHVPGRGEKLHNLGAREARRLDEMTIRNELEKCDRVCRNCHALRTWKRQHGKSVGDQPRTPLPIMRNWQ
jgi:hypothetical protein